MSSDIPPILDRLCTYKSVLKPEELAEVLNLSPDDVLQLSSENGIPFMRIGNAIRFSPAEIAQWLNAHVPAA